MKLFSENVVRSKKKRKQICCILQTNKTIEKLIKNPKCLLGGPPGPKASAVPPFCMKSGGAPEAFGAVEACNTGGKESGGKKSGTH